MKLRNHLQEQKGVAARAAANIYCDAALVFGKKVSDVLNWLVVSRTDISYTCLLFVRNAHPYFSC